MFRKSFKPLFISIILIILLSISSFAAHTAITTIDPDSVYEDEANELILSITNNRSSTASITKITVDFPTSLINVTQIGDPDYIGSSHTWNAENTTENDLIDTITWQQNDGIERATQLFYLDAYISEVVVDEIGTVEIETTDSNNETNTQTIQFTVLNDDAPNVTLISPTGDYNVQDIEFIFEVDDLDFSLGLTIACEVYLDGNLERTIDAEQTNRFNTTLDEGQHEWYVVCTDRRSQSTTTDTEEFTVDLTPPEITSLTEGTFLRTQPIEISAEITDDLSGINEEMPYANLTFNGEVVCTAPLRITESDIYTGECTTDSTWDLGEYNVIYYAEDNAGNSVVEDTQTTELNNTNTTSEVIIDLTYSYIVSITLDSNNITEGDTVTITGTVTYDNGSSIPENTTEVLLIGAQSEIKDIEIINDSFTTDFTITTAGNYDITARVTAENGVTFEDTENLTVNEEEQQTQGGGGGSGGGGSPGSRDAANDGDGRAEIAWTCGDGYCDFNENCEKCSEDCGVCESDDDEESEPEVVEVASTDTADLVYYCGDGHCDPSENCKKCSEDCGECSINNGDNEYVGKGVGQAFGFLNLDKLTAGSLMPILIIAAMIIILLILLGRKGKGKDDLGLEDYLNQRHN
ncbi:hypothetical protein ACFL0W_03075 [Nanoarchaeota archaeon]